MIKLSILNIREFLKVVNACEGEVCMICPDGRKENIAGNNRLQRELQDRYRNNKNSLPLALDIRTASDYLRIVNYYAGDC